MGSVISRKIISLKMLIFWADGPYPHIDQNVISGKSTKNAPTSRAPNFFKNGRTRLVYDSFWSHGPPKLQKTCLGWFPQLARPQRADLRIFSIFSEISIWAAATQKVIFFDFRVRKNDRKLLFFQIFFIFQKIWNFSSRMVYLHRAYSQ